MFWSSTAQARLITPIVLLEYGRWYIATLSADTLSLISHKTYKIPSKGKPKIHGPSRNIDLAHGSFPMPSSHQKQSCVLQLVIASLLSSAPQGQTSFSSVSLLNVLCSTDASHTLLTISYLND